MLFELLAVDTTGAGVIQNDKSLLYALLSNTQLWKNPSIKNDKQIEDGTIRVEVAVVEPDKSLAESFLRGFHVRVSGEFSDIEALRKPITHYLKNQKFDSLYILVDEASGMIAGELYPLIYRVENLLRQYLIKFMVTKLGPNWWNATATSEQSQKAEQRKNNERVFGEHIDNKAYLIDFGDLGKMIYSQSSGFKTKEDILKKINEIEETPEAIRALKEQLQTNYQKFFKASFKDRDFQLKWETLEKLRNKVAHNNLFTSDDLVLGKQHALDLISIIEEADKDVDKVVIGVEEKEALQEDILSKGYTWDVISEEEFLKELVDLESENKKADRFVGLAHFVKMHLGAKGYNFKASYETASRLEAKGSVEIYYVNNPYGDEKVAAIKTLDSNAPPEVHA